MNEKLTTHDAYLAMYYFLERHYERTASDDLGSLLGSMSLLEDGSPADPAFEKDWGEAVEKAFSGDHGARLMLKSGNEPIKS